MNEYKARHADDLDPWHPLMHLAPAGFEKDAIRADFPRGYSLAATLTLSWPCITTKVTVQ